MRRLRVRARVSWLRAPLNGVRVYVCGIAGAVFYGDLFADDAFVCSSTHYSTYAAYITWDEIYPGAGLTRAGTSGSLGAACRANMGSNAQEIITAAARAEYGSGGTYAANKQQTRHTVNNMVVEFQNATHMKTQHYQVRRACGRCVCARARARVGVGGVGEVWVGGCGARRLTACAWWPCVVRADH